jgi:aryl-alcohol dehydrogenase-like predicted oxidoreductase
MKQLPNRRLGKSDIEVSPIGLGVMQLSGGGKGMMSKAFLAIPDDESDAIIKPALDGGINWFDTAAIYGSGRSEARLSACIKAVGKRSKKRLCKHKEEGDDRTT